MSKQGEILRRIHGLQHLLNQLIEQGAAYRKIYFISLLINRLHNQLYFCAGELPERR